MSKFKDCVEETIDYTETIHDELIKYCNEEGDKLFENVDLYNLAICINSAIKMKNEHGNYGDNHTVH